MTSDSRAKFWDKVAEKYSKRPVPDEAVYKKKLEITQGYFEADMEILELGCGTGTTAIAHAPFVARVLATDISQGMIDIARKKAKSQGVDNVTFEVGAVDDIAVADESVDAVLALSLLHLLEDRDSAIAAIHRMLKPGGIFVTSTVCLGDNMRWFRFVGPIGRFFGFMPLVRIFTVAELKRSLTDAGFEIDHEWKPEKSQAVFIVAKK